MYNIKSIAKAGKPWKHLRIYFDDKRLRKVLNISKEKNLYFLDQKPIEINLYYRILSMSNLYFDMKKEDWVFPKSHIDKDVENFIRDILYQKFNTKTVPDMEEVLEYIEQTEKVFKTDTALGKNSTTLNHLFFQSIRKGKTKVAVSYIMLGATEVEKGILYAKYLGKYGLAKVLEKL